MSIQVKFWPTKHPHIAGDFFTLKSKRRGTYTFDMLADDISHHCSLTRADVAGCMEALIEFTATRLMDGYVVQYYNFGNFFIKPDTKMLT